MPTDTPFTSAVSLTYPPDDGAAAVARSNSVTGTYQNKVDLDLVLSGSSTHTVCFGTLATTGAKAVQIEVAPVEAGGSAAPINVIINGGSDPWEISQGGHLSLGSPAPTAAGILSMDIVHTQDACVKVRLLG